MTLPRHGSEVFVGNLPPTTTDADLLRAFEQGYRSTSTAHVVRRGQGRLYGFVAFGRQEDMEKALTKMNLVFMEGRSKAAPATMGLKK